MIHVIPELRLNDYKECHCIKPKDLYARLGKKVQPNVDFESSDEPIPMNMSKLDQLQMLQDYDKQMQYEASRKAGTDAASNGHSTSESSQTNDEDK